MSNEEEEEAKLFETFKGGYCELSVVQLIMRFLFGRYREAQEAMDQIENSLTMRSIPYYAVSLYFGSLTPGVTHKFLSPSIPMLSGMIENNLFSKLTRQALCIYA